jgi:hypothetical protein
VPKKTSSEKKPKIPPGAVIYGKVNADRPASPEYVDTLDDKPNLNPFVFEQIEVALHDVDKRWWKELRKFQVPTAVMGMFLGEDGPRPPKRPLQLTIDLASYAQSLFYAEASKYPQNDPRFRHWAMKLAERLETRVMRIVKEIDASYPLMNLDYQGLTEELMREVIRDALKQEMHEPPALHQQKHITGTVSKPSAIVPMTPYLVEPINKQLQSLRSECRMTIEQIADSVHLTPRSVSRHLSGEAAPRPGHLTVYESLFTEKTGRKIHLKTS